MAGEKKKDVAPEEPTQETDAPTEEAPPEAPPSVVIQKKLDEFGNVGVDVQAVGGVQATEIQTLLELGVKRVREVLGIA